MNAAPDRFRALRRLAASVGAVAVVFTGLTASLMAFQYGRAGFGKPPWSGEIENHLARFDKGDNSADMREALRRMDAELRADYFRLRAFYARGAWLLAAGAAATILCVRLHADTTPPRPSAPRRDDEPGAARSLDARRSRAALAVVAAALLAAMSVSWGLGAATRGPRSAAASEAHPHDK